MGSITLRVMTLAAVLQLASTHPQSARPAVIVPCPPLRAGWVSTLQFQCANPFVADLNKIRRMMKVGAPKLRQRVSCPVYVATATDTWMSVSSRYRTTVNQLMRSNPQLVPQANNIVGSGARLYIPPCNDGVLQGSKVAGALGAAKPVPGPRSTANIFGTALPVDVATAAVATTTKTEPQPDVQAVPELAADVASQAAVEVVPNAPEVATLTEAGRRLLRR